jgi:hypothetical protein
MLVADMKSPNLQTALVTKDAAAFVGQQDG